MPKMGFPPGMPPGMPPMPGLGKVHFHKNIFFDDVSHRIFIVLSTKHFFRLQILCFQVPPGMPPGMPPMGLPPGMPMPPGMPKPPGM